MFEGQEKEERKTIGVPEKITEKNNRTFWIGPKGFLGKSYKKQYRKKR